jgi:muconolactone delta-isomerase
VHNHPSVEDADKTVASVPMVGFMTFEIGALADIDETVKAYVESPN